jgi:membrane peptidoglycan carboxypeptidase
MGFTPDLVAGVWFGHPQNVPLKGVFSSYAAQAWHDVVDTFYTNHPRPPQPFYTASNEFAALNGLIHLIDPKGVAEAKKALAAKGIKGDGLNGLAPSVTTQRKTQKALQPDEQEDSPAPFSVKVDGQSVNLDPTPVAANPAEKPNEPSPTAPVPPPLPPLN